MGGQGSLIRKVDPIVESSFAESAKLSQGGKFIFRSLPSFPRVGSSLFEVCKAIPAQGVRVKFVLDRIGTWPESQVCSFLFFVL